MATLWSVTTARRRSMRAPLSHGPQQFTGTAFVLDPPYARLRAISLAPGGVGSILVADLTGGISGLAAGLAVHRPSPWCPLVLLADQVALADEELATFEPFPGCLGRAVPYSRERQQLIDSVIEAVRHRAAPSNEVLAGYVVKRTGCAMIEPALLELFEGIAGSRRIGRSVTRHLAAFGPFGARDWQGVIVLARLLASSRLVSSSLERTALDAGIDPRTLRRWMRLASDLEWRAVAHRPGWEWLIESALRKAGYVR